MAKYELRLLCSSEDGSYIKAEMFEDNDKTVERVIDITIVDEEHKKHHVVLDKSTAIKFAKTLRTEINKISEREVKRG